MTSFWIFRACLMVIAIFIFIKGDATANDVLEGRCHMGTCIWLRFGVPSLVKTQGAEALKKVSISVGESDQLPNGDRDKNAPIKWSSPDDVYALCSTSRPAVVHPDYSDKTKWVAQFLAPGYPAGVFGYLVETYVEYFKICHNIDNPKEGDLALAKKFGYPPGLVLRISDMPVTKPEDVLLARLPAPDASLRDIASLYITIPEFTWEKGGFGNVMVATFTIENKNPFPIKDISIACVMHAPSGTVLSEVEKTIYQIFPADGRTIVRDFSMGLIDNQSERAACKIEAWREG
jgi:hypothetical protein